MASSLFRLLKVVVLLLFSLVCIAGSQESLDAVKQKLESSRPPSESYREKKARENREQKIVSAYFKAQYSGSEADYKLAENLLSQELSLREIAAEKKAEKKSSNKATNGSIVARVRTVTRQGDSWVGRTQRGLTFRSGFELKPGSSIYAQRMSKGVYRSMRGGKFIWVYGNP